MKNPKPEPVIITIVCSLCGQPWEAHGDQDNGEWKKPTAEDCIRLLKAELAKRPAYTITYPYTWQVAPGHVRAIKDDEDPPDAVAAV
jgi:hypothetical protein